MKTVEELQAERVSAVREYAKKVGDIVSGLVLSPKDRLALTSQKLSIPTIISAADHKLLQVANLLDAVQRYPLFDPNCLLQVEEREARVQNFRTNRMESGKIPMPIFAVARWRMSQVTHRGSPMDSIEVGNITYRLKRPGFQIVDKDGLDRTGEYRMEFTAEVPTPPPSVADRVDLVVDRFDQVDIAFEAEWVPTPVKDPLIIGTVLGHHFLIDEYDMTKRERYVMSEFTRRV